MQKVLFIAVIIIVAGLIIWRLFDSRNVRVVTNFEECVAAGNPVMESYPRQCRHGDQTFAEELPADGSGILPFDSGVEGRILLGPICPVMRDPPDPQCADQPYKTTVRVIAVGSSQGSPFAVVESDENGRYRVILPPGKYNIQPMGGTPLPSCGTRTITIEPNVMQELNLSCDTGIR